jgi:integrase
MPRHVRNHRIESRTARAKIKPSPKPIYVSLGGKLHLGYSRGKGAGSWTGRLYLGAERYTTRVLGECDDIADADGVEVLDFRQAQDRAREWMKELDDAARIAAFGPTITVADAAKAYLEAGQGAAAYDAKGKLKHLGKLAAMPLAALTVADLSQWRMGLLDRMGEAAARRVANTVRAALNFAAKRHAAKLPASIRATISDGLTVPRGVLVENGREPQILTTPDVRRLVDAALQIDEEQGWGGDLARMVLILAASGARFSQVARLRVADLQIAERRLMVPSSRKGSGASKISHIPVPIDDDIVRALKSATVGRLGSDPLLMRPKWRRAPGPKLVMERYEHTAWRTASEITRPWALIVERAGLPAGIVPYAFRHSSIVRGLRARLPLQLVAKSHDTSSGMIEKHYARHIGDALSELSRAALTPLMPTAPVPFDRSSRQ